jgi:adenylate cyclase class IV
MRKKRKIEIRNDLRGELDEVVGFGCYVHLERMDRHWFCLIVEDGKRRVMLNVGTRAGHRAKATIYADEPA